MRTDLLETLELEETLVNYIGERVNIKKIIGEEYSLGDLLKVELVKFLMYLSAGDGKISRSEASFINECFYASYTPHRINEVIAENNLYSTEFEEEIPTILRIAVAIDNTIYAAVNEKAVNVELSGSIIKIYYLMGSEMINLEGNDENQKRDFMTYIGNMQRFVDENKDSMEDVPVIFNKYTGGSFKLDGLDLSEDGAVKAPEKK